VLGGWAMNVDTGKMDIRRDEMDNIVPKKIKPKGKPRGGSRKGRPNKNTKAIKDMILGALASAGGEEWLLAQSKANPTAFMALLGKVLPSEMQVSGRDGERLAVDVHFLGNMYK